MRNIKFEFRLNKQLWVRAFEHEIVYTPMRIRFQRLRMLMDLLPHCIKTCKYHGWRIVTIAALKFKKREEE